MPVAIDQDDDSFYLSRLQVAGMKREVVIDKACSRVKITCDKAKKKARKPSCIHRKQY